MIGAHPRYRQSWSDRWHMVSRWLRMGCRNNQYICPEGEALKQFRRNYSDPNRGPTGKGVAKYQALKHTCQACPSKLKCCPNADARKITREENEDARDVARAIRKTRQYKISSKLRKKVEMLFAHPFDGDLFQTKKAPTHGRRFYLNPIDGRYVHEADAVRLRGD